MGPGSATPAFAKISTKVGTTKIIITPTTIVATESKMVGYIMALLSARMIFIFFSKLTDILFKKVSRPPLASPALTNFIYTPQSIVAVYDLNMEIIILEKNNNNYFIFRS